MKYLYKYLIIKILYKKLSTTNCARVLRIKKTKGLATTKIDFFEELDVF